MRFPRGAHWAGVLPVILGLTACGGSPTEGSAKEAAPVASMEQEEVVESGETLPIVRYYTISDT